MTRYTKSNFFNQVSFSGRRSESNGNEYQLVIQLKSGLGLSLVSRNPDEELLYAFLSNIIIDYQHSDSRINLDGSIQNLQIDNQIPNSYYPVILYLSPTNRTEDLRHFPAIHFTAEKCNKNRSRLKTAEIYKHLIVTVKNLTLTLEEDLLCKLFKFSGILKSEFNENLANSDETVYQNSLVANPDTKTLFYYFGSLKITLHQVRLSVIKSGKLSAELKMVKQKLGLSLITFEDANIELDPFVRIHPFETIEFLTNSVVKHYQDELLSQAVLILGSTDFLGNPIGFLNDLSEGVAGFVSDGNVGGLIKNVAHGAANSTAKVS